MPLSTEEQALLTSNLLRSQQEQIKERKGHARQEAIERQREAEKAKAEAIATGSTTVAFTRRQVPGHLEDIGKAPETVGIGESRQDWGDPTRDKKYKQSQ